jgi:hypothetical protein
MASRSKSREVSCHLEVDTRLRTVARQRRWRDTEPRAHRTTASGHFLRCEDTPGDPTAPKRPASPTANPPNLRAQPPPPRPPTAAMWLAVLCADGGSVIAPERMRTAGWRGSLTPVGC